MTPLSPWERVLARAAAVTGVSVGEIRGPSRRRGIVRVRCAVVCALREAGQAGGRDGAELGYERIARRLGGRNHSTVIHAHRAGLALIESDAAFRVLVEDLAHAARGGVAAVRWVAAEVGPARGVPLFGLEVEVREEEASRRQMARGSADLASALASYNRVIGA